MLPVILLGLGFTTRRLATRFLLRGMPVFAAVRNADRFRDLTALGLRLDDFPGNSILIHTIPPLAHDENRTLRESIQRLKPSRVVYISSTGVYGNQTMVNEKSEPVPSNEKGTRRIEEENWLANGPWQTLIVRPAAIYGPGRGIQVRILEGRAPRTEPSGITSRIHVDDLAAVLEAGALSDLTGAWPLADDHPSSTKELAAWCGRLLRREIAHEWNDNRPVPGREVDGRKIRELLGIGLRYPSYESGVLASLAVKWR